MDWLNSWRWPLAAISGSLMIAGLVALYAMIRADAKAGADTWWRQHIAEATGQLNADAAKEGAGIVASDEEWIVRLGEAEHARKEAERRLGDLQASGGGERPGCPRIPAQCLR